MTDAAGSKHAAECSPETGPGQRALALRDPLLHETRALWSIERGSSPVIATAIHEGHCVRTDLADQYALTSDERLREEDPYTAYMIRDVDNRIVFHRSRFEVDLNRDRKGAIYLSPEQAWGLKVWSGILPPAILDASLRIHDAYYETLHTTLRSLEQEFGRFVLLDIHSYNHRRDGPDAAPTQQASAPDVNIGTFSMDQERWRPIVDALIAHLSSFQVNGRPLDVRENVAFQGKGEQTRFVHEHFKKTGCAIAVEFKKFFMDEWTGKPDVETLDRLRNAIATAVPILEKTLEARS
ncbi:N-formylglutamate amidohydrolase [Neorhizobium sp. JUb45]|uniref:N-formylglutamate amidohydrolase n=1 Tax=unclassified Neorhizobium TaxID=2629175 RepID=UPI001042A47B|nr:N-formylglutamate amidohydrolase [Neorhizobium sp. JUb45]TCR00543.1 N-formylglutamate amidohydrolase [Neorhizobium sp. JUb45]